MTAPQRPLRGAVIGSGGIARLRHIPSFEVASRLGLAELIVVCDAVRESALDAQRQFGVPESCFDYREVIARDDIDLVTVATPNAYHEAISIAALDAGKHVMCEKPLAMSYAGALRMGEVARRSGKKTSVNFRYRWVPSARYLHEMVEAGELGDIYQIFLNFFNASVQDPDRPMRWRQNKAESGSGELGDLGSHMIDFAHWLVGPTRRVSARLTTFTRERPLEGGGRAAVEVDDAATCLVDYASGATGVINASGVALGRGNHQRVEIYGTKGSAIYEIERWDRGGDHLLVCFGDAQSRHAQFARANVPPAHAQSNPLDPFIDFYRAIHDDRDAPVTFEDAIRAQEVIEAAERSAAAGAWVDLPIDP